MTDQPTPAPVTPEQLAELARLHTVWQSGHDWVANNFRIKLAGAFPALQDTIEGLWRENERLRQVIARESALYTDPSSPYDPIGFPGLRKGGTQ